MLKVIKKEQLWVTEPGTYISPKMPFWSAYVLVAVLVFQSQSLKCVGAVACNSEDDESKGSINMSWWIHPATVL